MVGKASRPFLSSVVAVVLASALQPRLGSAQISVEDTSPWLTEVGFVGINAVLGGVTAGVTSLIRGNSFSDAFTAGALGGTMSYAGKRVAASRFYGAGLIGRQVGAVGASLTRAASTEEELFDSVLLPLGPLRLQLRPRALADTRVLVDLSDVYWLAYGTVHDEMDLDLSESLSAGVAVFRTERAIATGEPYPGGRANGRMTGGAVIVSSWSHMPIEDVLAHERVHVLQHDFFAISMGYELERWAMSVVGVDDVPVIRHLLPGVAVWMPAFPLRGLGNYDLLEAEAEFLEGRR
jgi:hypothetical protein